MRRFLSASLVACLMGCATPSVAPPYTVCDAPDCAPARDIPVVP